VVSEGCCTPDPRSSCLLRLRLYESRSAEWLRLSCSLRASVEPPCVCPRSCSATGTENEYRANGYSRPLTCAATLRLVSGSQSWGIRRGKLLVLLNPSVPICGLSRRSPFVAGIWCEDRINPIGPISSEIFLERYSPPESPSPSVPGSVV
jgi:hypothetical protein